ncbi:MAG: hypothetical protein K2X80_03330, partial [Pseudomonadaceae bacterium]|nr:hypothetical protein [Pseudomonadaceae bacterium]
MVMRSYQLSVDIKDQLTVVQGLCNHQPMVETQEIRDAFSRRLNQALDGKEGVRDGRGRNVDFYAGIKSHPSAKASKQATHKWLHAESMPSRGNMIAIAEWLGVRLEWLAHGEGPMQAGQAAVEAPAPAMNMAVLQKLKGKATPRSMEVINRIEKAAQQGRLKEA